MKIVTTTDIYFEGRVYPTGHRFDTLSDSQCRSLIAQGVAKKATRVIEVDDDEQEPAAEANAASTASQAQQAPAQEAQGDAPANPVAVNKNMSREKLVEIAMAEGFTEAELEKIDTKAEVVQAIKDRRANPAQEAQGDA